MNLQTFERNKKNLKEQNFFLFAHQINSSSCSFKYIYIRLARRFGASNIFFVDVLLNAVSDSCLSECRWFHLLINFYFCIFSFQLESVSCNHCQKTERCLPDLLTNKPSCVYCKRPNGRCPVEVRITFKNTHAK